jgi:predicted O-linked N-acetylglucosamine transferase (SPINDLY family)
MMQQQEEYRTELVANLTGCWQPSVMNCIRNLNRSKRPLFTEATGEKFGIHSLVDLARISLQVLELLLALLMDLPGAILYLYGAPSMQISATLRNMQSYAERHGLDKNYFDGRVEWWGHLPMEDHGQRMRDKVHVCLAFGPSTGHTGVSLALCVGVPVVTEEGLFGGGDISSWVPTSMLRMVGLGALAVPNGSGLAGPLVRQLYRDGELLSTLQGILDNQATSSTGFFDPERTANDLAELVIAHHVSSDSDPPARDFISRHAELPFFELDQNGMLQPTARVVVGEGEDQRHERERPRHAVSSA